MKIVFFASNVVPFHAFTLKERALGGTETAVIRLAEALSALGHEVSVFTPFENPPDSKPRYFHHSQIEAHGPVDALISVRDWIPSFYKIQARCRFVWTGDSYDQFSNFGLGDKRVAGALDALLTVSDWQADKLSEASGFPRQKCWKLGNGIDLSLFEAQEERQRRRLIYSSTPYRGLRHIPRFYAPLKEKYPDLECHIFSGYSIYNQAPNDHYAEMLRDLQQFPGVHVHDSIKQDQLAREFLKSSILFYPNEFEETSCITAMEAMAAGCVVLSSQLGALPETVGDAGFLVAGMPGQPDYDQSFIEHADQLLSNDALWKDLSEKGKLRAENLTWKKTAERLAQFLWLLMKQER
jgi:glycosyltransferase involved in cell wall biosynthesis